jgi:hypothetical protein
MTHYQQWQIDHYTARLEQARIQGDVKAIAFLRGELHRLSKEETCELESGQEAADNFTRWTENEAEKQNNEDSF